MSDWVKRFLPFASLVALCVVIAAVEPKFLSSGNLAGVARQTAVITIIAMGMTVVMVSGGIDLSVGSVMALAGVAGALVMAAGAPPLAGVAAALAAGAACGLANGVAIAALRIPPFIVTLGAMGIYRGVALLATDGKAVVGHARRALLLRRRQQRRGGALRGRARVALPDHVLRLPRRARGARRGDRVGAAGDGTADRGRGLRAARDRGRRHRRRLPEWRAGERRGDGHR